MCVISFYSSPDPFLLLLCSNHSRSSALRLLLCLSAQIQRFERICILRVPERRFERQHDDLSYRSVPDTARGSTFRTGQAGEHIAVVAGSRSRGRHPTGDSGTFWSGFCRLQERQEYQSKLWAQALMLLQSAMQDLSSSCKQPGTVETAKSSEGLLRKAKRFMPGSTGDMLAAFDVGVCVVRAGLAAAARVLSTGRRVLTEYICGSVCVRATVGRSCDERSEPEVPVDARRNRSLLQTCC